ncbi:carbohydrate-binding module family 5 protein [Hydnomerulius pinastri MD-312]|uniref:chitinase n=1 Tax=Hydnomerulius pinastri MD-312 TaxID=994086 RepID=A0A0C9VLC2_9AGAM|nr:carbohydrate-binding module family 5 protein [Hydnomerulius pinastri MD-312]KIJ58400.1 carbohydrate-binding module family 5 protein [Hydnomerulius pinastri MD-312]
MKDHIHPVDAGALMHIFVRVFKVDKTRKTSTIQTINSRTLSSPVYKAVEFVSLCSTPLLSFLLCFLAISVKAFDISANTNLAVYWGQNSYGVIDASNTTGWQTNLSHYCEGVADIFPIAFVDQFNSTGGLPSLNLANTCSTSNNSVFPGTNLPNCSFMAEDIQACQAAGKIVTISLGGATATPNFADDDEGVAFAHIIWDLFLGGNSIMRPFGNAILDGIDMDIEGGNQTGLVSFFEALRNLMIMDSKSYYITAAPQCPFPDAYIGDTLNSFGFDAVFVQFYNNYCGLTNFNTTSWNFGTWDNWAKNGSKNNKVKVYIGAPASSGAAGSGYVDAPTMATIIEETMSKYPATFGGVMLWDASAAYANGRYDIAVKQALIGSSGVSGGTTTTNSTAIPATLTPPQTLTAPSLSVTTSTAIATPAGPVSCAGVTAWQTGIAYVDGNQVTSNGDLWVASWWTYNDMPGDVTGVWIDNGPCASAGGPNVQAPTAPAGSGQTTFGIPSGPVSAMSGAPAPSGEPTEGGDTTPVQSSFAQVPWTTGPTATAFVPITAVPTNSAGPSIASASTSRVLTSILSLGSYAPLAEMNTTPAEDADPPSPSTQIIGAIPPSYLSVGTPLPSATNATSSGTPTSTTRDTATIGPVENAVPSMLSEPVNSTVLTRSAY